MKSITRRTLIQLGLSPAYKGYDAIVEAVELLSQHKDTKITAIYTQVAKKLNSTYSRVERNIRHACEIVMNRADLDTLNNIFGYTIRIDGTITNGDFLSCLTNHVEVQYIHE